MNERKTTSQISTLNRLSQTTNSIFSGDQTGRAWRTPIEASEYAEVHQIDDAIAVEISIGVGRAID